MIIFSYIVYSILWLLTLLPLWVLYLFSDIMFFLSYYVTGYRKKVVIESLRSAFPGKTKQEINKIARKFYRHFCDLFIETIKILNISEKEITKRMSFLNPEILDPLYAKNKSIVLVSGHYNNWEWTIRIPIVVKHKVLILYRPLKNKFVNKLINKLRSSYGIIMISMQESYKVILNHLDRGENILTWFLADQSPHGATRPWITFLNQDTLFFQGPEKIAMKSNQAFVFLDIQKIKRGYYTVEFKLLYEDVSGCEPHEITKKFAETLEQEIIKQPEYWLWSHRRWKHKKMD